MYSQEMPIFLNDSLVFSRELSILILFFFLETESGNQNELFFTSTYLYRVAEYLLYVEEGLLKLY